MLRPPTSAGRLPHRPHPWLVLGVGLLLVLLTVEALAREKRKSRSKGRHARALAELPAPWRGEVFVVGSSSIRFDLGKTIEIDLRERGFDVLRHGVSGTGLTRPERYDWFATSAWLPVSSRTLAVLIYLGVNDGQGVHEVGREWIPGLGRPSGRGETVSWNDTRWSHAYMRRYVAFIDSFCRRGARDVFVLLPVDLKNRGLEEKMVRIRNLQMEAVRWSQCGRVLDTRGDAGHFLTTGAERAAPRRKRDGFHMTTLGAQIVWERVRDRVVSVLDRLDAEPAFGAPTGPIEPHPGRIFGAEAPRHGPRPL